MRPLPGRGGPAPLPDRPGRWKLLWRRRRRLGRRLVLATCLLAVLAGGATVLRGSGGPGDLASRLGLAAARLGLRVQDVVVLGRVKTPEPLLRAAIAARPGDPILAWSVRDARARIETINWVQSATVERLLPGTIQVVLHERSPFAVWQSQGRFTLIDRDGNTVTDSDVAAFAGQLPLVVGTGAPAAAAAMLDALAQVPAVQSHVAALVRVGGRRWNMRMNNGADVLLPEGAEAQALARLAELQAAHALLDRPLQSVDLRLPDRLVVRPFPQPGPDPAHRPGDATRKPT